MKIHNVEQGTPEWSALRAGIPTASQFHRIVTRSGKKSEQREAYMMELLAERMLGRPLEPIKTLPTEHGSITEAEAVAWYHLMSDTQTERVGFVTDDDERWGASPDRFVGDSGLLEIKCPSNAGIHVGHLLKSGSVYDKNLVQCSGQLWICERDWTDVMSYYPELPEALVRVNRNEKMIAAIEQGVRDFSAELEFAWESIVADGLVQQPKRKVITEQAELVNALKESLLEVKRAR